MFTVNSAEPLEASKGEGVCLDFSLADVSSNIKGNSGRKRKYYTDQLRQIPQIPLTQRTTLRDISHRTHIPYGTIQRLLNAVGYRTILLLCTHVSHSLTKLDDCSFVCPVSMATLFITSWTQSTSMKSGFTSLVIPRTLFNRG